MAEGEREAQRYSDHFREWLRHGMSGCHFASTLAARAAKAGRVAYWTILGALRAQEVSALDSIIDGSANEGRFFVAIFPHLRSAGDVATLLRTLAAHDRWTATRVDWRNHRRDDATLVGLNWMTAASVPTSVMGFAPLGTMPVTRRAPYVALFLWPDLHANPYRKDKRGPLVGFVDGAHGMGRPRYERVWTSTKDKVGNLLADPPEDRPWLRQVAFVLPSEATQGLPLEEPTAT